jgi:1-acyl-sn-glycerol-3-phosphate acyltransferase
MSRLRAGFILTAFAVMTLPGLAVQQILIWVSPGAARRFPHSYHRVVARLLGIRMRISGTPVRHRASLIAVNHVSWLDIPVLSAVVPLSFIAKREVASWPFFGTLARLQRTVFIDRERRQTTATARDEMRARLADGETLVLFAEGTSSDGLRVLPFKTAFFAAAEVPGVVVQPISLVYHGHWGVPMTRRRRPCYAWYGDMDMGPHLLEALASGPIEVDVICHEPISLEQAGSRKALARQSEDVVRRGLIAALSGRNRAFGSLARGNAIGDPRPEPIAEPEVA